MKITVSNYASKRSELLENSNKKLVEIVEGLSTDTVEVYGLDPEIDESIDVILEQINKALDAQAKPKEEPEKPSPKEVKKISKAKSLLGISKDNKEKGKAFAKSKQKKVAPKPASTSRPASIKKLFKGTLDEGDIVKDQELDKTLKVKSVNGNKFEGVLIVDDTREAVVIKPIQKVKAKEVHLKSPFEEGQLVKRGKLLFLVTNAKSNTVSLEEIDGKMLKNQSIEGFKAAPIALLDERISKTKASIRELEKKIETESEALRKLYKISSTTLQEIRGMGRLGTDAETKFKEAQALTYQKMVLTSIHKKDRRALKLIAKKSNIEWESLGKMPKRKKFLGLF
ncbi:hypothetical protein [Flectobacillus sp. BAB-3569]|uniref:hypothetical protein n=1 Tax=Flectobacillus sp. BAB-3569 TaxID=1509483 RepID=UPI000BA426AC|nr:hypothetical protein [Flectobacillus sp. BAB-3569]PAC33372.1 hypothetical protein BWI92_02355 [Flectobacillus sp. BAB-3569]